MLFPVFVFPLAVLILRGLKRTPRDEAWLPHSLQVSMVIGSIGWVGYKYLLLTTHFDELVRRHLWLLRGSQGSRSGSLASASG